MKIAGIQKTSTVDFPGKLAAVLFTVGCNYNCFYCHNRHLLQKPALLSEREARAFLKKRAGLLDGVVLSGGEPTLQKDLGDCAAFLKGLGYCVKLDTNGSDPDTVERLLLAGLLDYVAVDYKVPFDRYADLTGGDGAAVRETVRLLAGHQTDWELRTTLIPQIAPDDLKRMAQEVPELPRYALQQYHVQEGDTRFLKGLLPYTPAQIRALAEGIRAWQPNVLVRC